MKKYECTHCKKTKAAAGFYKCAANTYRDGLACWCKICNKLTLGGPRKAKKEKVKLAKAEAIVAAALKKEQATIQAPFEYLAPNGTLLTVYDLARDGVVLQLLEKGKDPDEASATIMTHKKSRELSQYLGRTNVPTGK